MDYYNTQRKGRTTTWWSLWGLVECHLHISSFAQWSFTTPWPRGQLSCQWFLKPWKSWKISYCNCMAERIVVRSSKWELKRMQFIVCGVEGFYGIFESWGFWSKKFTKIAGHWRGLNIWTSHHYERILDRPIILLLGLLRM